MAEQGPEQPVQEPERRVTDVEQILPTLATKTDVETAIAPLATKAELQTVKAEPRTEIKAEGETTRRHSAIHI